MSSPDVDIVDEILIEFVDESLEGLEAVTGLFVELEANPDDEDTIASIFRPVHSIKGTAAYFDLFQVKKLAHEMETVLDLVRKGAHNLTNSDTDLLLRGCDELTSMLQRSRNGEPEVIDQATVDNLVQSLIETQTDGKYNETTLWNLVLASLKEDEQEETLETATELARLSPAGREALGETASGKPQGEPNSETTVDSATDPDAAVKNTKSAAKAIPAAKSANKSMRVPEKSIDTFLAHVGELLTVHEMYSMLCKQLTADGTSSQAAAELRRVNETFGSLSDKLQLSVMEIRKTPVNTILQKIPRMVRDIARSSGKEIDLAVSGGEIIVDKSLVDTLNAPLTHMVRNAADHGIETTQERLEAEKPQAGSMTVSVTETADDIILTVRDDGRGLNREALAEKAVEVGLIKAGAQLTDEDMVSLLFMSGVSTAAEVTDVSGRGVGMDVVKRGIEQAGGSISVESTPGTGSEFTVRLPKSVSTQIITGLSVQAGGTRCLIPLKAVVRSFRPEESDVAKIRDRGECILSEDKWIPLVRLDELFAGQVSSERSNVVDEGILVVLDSGTQNVAAHVEVIDGMQQVVLREIEGMSTSNDLFLGGAILGDGSVSMVLDIDQII